ncbi:MAG: hypothetical protein ACI9LY_000224 [Arenicella sp.]|jgi:hypothetical protein
MCLNYHSKNTVIRLVRDLLFTLTITAVIAGCTTTSTVNKWPRNLPDRSIFVDTFTQQKLSGTISSTLEPHLVWIKRFYLGSIIYPLGWNRMTQIMTDSVDQEVDKTKLKSRMYKLGLNICIEWAQDNRFRNIDSSMIAVWGNALRTAAEQNELLAFVDKIETDVDALLIKQLTAKDIVRERYYPVEDYDDF